LFKSSAIRIMSLVIPGAIIFFLSRPEGVIEIYSDGEQLFLKHIAKSKEESELLPITSSEFTWSYNYLVSGAKGNAGNKKTAVVNYDLLTLDVKTKTGDRFMICKELNQWQSSPPDWKYKVISKENKVPLFITSSNLKRLKSKFEKAKNS